MLLAHWPQFQRAWSIDYYSLKKVFLLGTVMLIGSRVLYFVAPIGPGFMPVQFCTIWACVSPPQVTEYRLAEAPSPGKTRELARDFD